MMLLVKGGGVTASQKERHTVLLEFLLIFISICNVVKLAKFCCEHVDVLQVAAVCIYHQPMFYLRLPGLQNVIRVCICIVADRCDL